MKTCKQQSEIEMRPRLALDRFKRYGRWICKQQSEIEMRHLPAVDRLTRYVVGVDFF